MPYDRTLDDDHPLVTGICPRCEKRSDTVEEQYSFGYYAGILCRECAIAGFSDHCGLLAGEPMGDPQTLDDYGHDGQD